MIATSDELEDAVGKGGEIQVDRDLTIPLPRTVRITRPCRILGGHFTRAEGAAFEITSGDVEFDGVQLGGGGTAAGYDEDQKLIYAHGTADAPLTNVRVRNCTLNASRGNNVWLEWCTDALVEGNHIETFLYSGIMVISGRRVVIAHNLVRDAPLSAGVVNTYGIALTDLENTEAARSSDCTIIGNEVSLIDWEGLDTHGGDGLTFVGNTVLGCPRGIALVTGNETRVVAPTNNTVTGNTVNAKDARRPLLAGVFLGGIANKPASATIVGNQLVGYPTPIITDHWNRAATYVGHNSAALVPWRAVDLGDDYTADPDNPPQYLVDGNTVYFRGGVVPAEGGVSEHTDVGKLPTAAAWPTRTTVIGQVKGADPAAGSAQLTVTPSGELQMLHGEGTDTFTYWLTGSYRVP